MKLIPLTNSTRFAVVDDRDYEKVSKLTWCLLNGGAMSTTRPYVWMHWVILGLWKNWKELEVDHRDWDRLNNRRKNLRRATRAQNNSNRRKPKSNVSGFKGVRTSRTGKNWLAIIGVNGHKILLGRKFKTALEAAKAYDEAAKKYHGEFAVLNIQRFPRLKHGS